MKYTVKRTTWVPAEHAPGDILFEMNLDKEAVRCSLADGAYCSKSEAQECADSRAAVKRQVIVTVEVRDVK